ncbi:MAG: DsbA family oxidoreductase [Polyangiaceae bacterium]
MSDELLVDVWSDIICPWCYIGKRRLEQAVQRFAARESVRVTWHAFELDPTAPRAYEPGSTLASRLAEKYGKPLAVAREMMDHVTEVAAADGLEFHFDRAKDGNTFDAHRLLALARATGRAGALGERFMRGYFSEGEAIGETESLVRLAVETGFSEHDVRAALESEELARAVRKDQADARALGIRGVPFFLVGQKYAASGAQPSDLLAQLLERAWAEKSTNSRPMA